MLARELGVMTATPALVEIDDETAAALNLSLQAKGLRVATGIAVGSSFMRPLHPAIGVLPEDAASEVPRLYGFDLAVQNPDRRPSNPNCALFEDRLLAYDFEVSFSFLWAVGRTHNAWEVSKHGLASKHLFYSRLRLKQPAWEPLISSLRALTPQLLHELMDALPLDWKDDVQEVRAHLLSLLESLDEFEKELQESVS